MFSMSCYVLVKPMHKHSPPLNFYSFCKPRSVKSNTKRQRQKIIITHCISQTHIPSTNWVPWNTRVPWARTKGNAKNIFKKFGEQTPILSRAMKCYSIFYASHIRSNHLFSLIVNSMFRNLLFDACSKSLQKISKHFSTWTIKQNPKNCQFLNIKELFLQIAITACIKEHCG